MGCLPSEAREDRLITHNQSCVSRLDRMVATAEKEENFWIRCRFDWTALPTAIYRNEYVSP